MKPIFFGLCIHALLVYHRNFGGVITVNFKTNNIYNMPAFFSEEDYVRRNLRDCKYVYISATPEICTYFEGDS